MDQGQILERHGINRLYRRQHFTIHYSLLSIYKEIIEPFEQISSNTVDIECKQ